jgi:prepilin-type processing-associated H-X9-DG protein
MHRRGFSILELLVIVIIVAILFAVLSPVFAQAREKSRAVSCLSNAKQLGLAMRLYMQDYDEQYVGSHAYPNTWNMCPQFIWADLIHPYIKSMQVYTCTSATQVGYVADKARSNCAPLISLWGDPPLGTSARPWRLGYFYVEGFNNNPIWCNDPTGNTCYHGMLSGSWYDPKLHDMTMDLGCADAAIEDMANTISLAEARVGCGNDSGTSSTAVIFRYPRDTDVTSTPRGDSDTSGCYGGAPSTKQGRIAKRHNGTFSAIFADGHAKALTQSTPNQWTRYRD